MNVKQKHSRYIPLHLTPPRITLMGIPKGYLGTSRTIQHIQSLIRQGVKDFYVRQKAIDILLERGVKPKDYLGEIKALFEWVQKNVRYTKDPFRVEVLHTARRMLELRAGDCDDMSVLLGAMLEAIGHPIRLVIVGPDITRPDFFSHIYLEASYKGKWIPLDPTTTHGMGWAPRLFVKKVFPLARRNIDSGENKMQGTSPSNPSKSVNETILLVVKALRHGAVPPKDVRVKHLIELLRQRNLLQKSRWLYGVLKRIWGRGLIARSRPRTTRRMLGLFRRWGLLTTARQPVSPRMKQSIRSLRSVALRPVPGIRAQALRGVVVQPTDPNEKNLGGCG